MTPKSGCQTIAKALNIYAYLTNTIAALYLKFPDSLNPDPDRGNIC